MSNDNSQVCQCGMNFPSSGISQLGLESKVKVQKERQKRTDRKKRTTKEGEGEGEEGEIV